MSDGASWLRLLRAAALGLAGLGWFAPAALAQEVSTAIHISDDEPATSEATVLRWKRNDKQITAAAPLKTVVPVAFDESVASSSTASSRRATQLRPPNTGGWNKTAIGSGQTPLLSSDRTIRLVAHDPFQDPFGDRVAQAIREPSLAPPAGVVVRVQDEAQPQAEKREEAKPEERPGPEKPGAQAETLPSPMPMPMEPEPGVVRNGLRVYNDRDCDVQDADCKTFIESLRTAPLANISLNIMPRYKPDAKTPEEDESERTDKIRLAGSRDWHDRTGKLVATGQMVDLQHGRVVIADDSGSEVARVLIKDLGRDELCFVAAWWRLPGECPLDDSRQLARSWVPATFTWTASALCHKPLYFEEVQLERYGHTAGPFKQPVLSGAHFFLNIAALPYKMGINPPAECQYALGYYRPGNCAPWHIPPVPLSARGALAEAGAWIGGVYLIP